MGDQLGRPEKEIAAESMPFDLDASEVDVHLGLLAVVICRHSRVLSAPALTDRTLLEHFRVISSSKPSIYSQPASRHP